MVLACGTALSPCYLPPLALPRLSCNSFWRSYAISLYANITGIKWKYDTEPNRVAGCESLLRHVRMRQYLFPETVFLSMWGYPADIAHAEADGVRSFDLDTSAYSEIALADKLWEVIDARPSARVA